jgi:hypothetical protein
MVKMQFPPGFTTGKLDGKEFLKLNPSLYEGMGDNNVTTKSNFVAEVVSGEGEDQPGLPHVVAVTFNIKGVSCNVNHFFINNKLHLGLECYEWRYWPNGLFLGDEFHKKCLVDKTLLRLFHNATDVIGPRPDGKGIFPDLNKMFTSSYDDEHGRVAHFHNHFTEVLGRAPHESVLEWQLKILVNCFKIILEQIDSPSGKFWEGGNGLDEIAFHLERMHQELRFIQVLCSGSENLGDKPMISRLYYDMLSESSLMASPWPDGDPGPELEFFPEISDQIFRFRKYAPSQFPSSGTGDTDESSSSDSH